MTGGTARRCSSPTTSTTAIIASPWTCGGYWRRSVAGDLTAAFDFTRPDSSIPDLPDTVPLHGGQGSGQTYTWDTVPTAGRYPFFTRRYAGRAA
jgi:hypothetical protein